MSTIEQTYGAEVSRYLETEIARTDEVGAREYLRWLSMTDLAYHIDDDVSDVPSIPADLRPLLQARTDEAVHALGYNRAWAAYTGEPQTPCHEIVEYFLSPLRSIYRESAVKPSVIIVTPEQFDALLDFTRP